MRLSAPSTTRKAVCFPSPRIASLRYRLSFCFGNRIQFHSVLWSSLVACAICQTRKEKRVCPALASRICAPCCGEQREVTLDCPADCAYLVQSRQSESPRRSEELQNEELFRNVAIPPQFRYQFEPLIAGLLFALARVAGSHKNWHDRDVIAALTDITRDRERQARSGLIYQEASPSPVT